VTGSEVEAEFLELLRSLNTTDRARAERLLSGVLSGRVTLTPGGVSRLKAGDIMALADALPAKHVRDWTAPSGPN
jgi:hypothetical protein